MAGDMTRAAAALFAALFAAAAGAPAAAQQPAIEPYVAAPQAHETTVDRMSPVMGRAYVRAIQRELAALGYSPGAADGVEGPRTRRAISAYQRAAGLRETGRASRELLDYMKFSAPRPGSGPAGIAEIQRLLAARGYYDGAIDGLAGPKTRSAIRRFQRDSGLAATGVIDRSLTRALR